MRAKNLKRHCRNLICRLAQRPAGADKDGCGQCGVPRRVWQRHSALLSVARGQH